MVWRARIELTRVGGEFLVTDTSAASITASARLRSYRLVFLISAPLAVFTTDLQMTERC